MNKKLIKKAIGSFKNQAILAPIFVIIEVLFEVLIPFEMSKIIDNGILKGNMNYILTEGLIVLIYAILALISGAMAGRFAAIAAAGYAKNIRKSLFYKIQEFSFKNIDRFSSPSLVTRLTTDINLVQNSFNMTIRLLTRTPLMVIFSVIMTVNINANIAFIFLILMPFMALIFILVPKYAHPRFLKVMKATDELNRDVKENVDAQRVVKSFVREEFEIDKFSKTNELIYKLNTRAQRMVQVLNPLLDLSIYIVIIVILLIGSKSIIIGSMSTGELTSIVVYAIQIMVSMMMLGIIFIFNIIAKPSIERINEVLDEEIDMKNPENPITDMKDGSIVFDHVGFSYDTFDSKVLDDININIKSGELIGIIGATGSAKTSLVNLIPRLYDVTKGSVKISGIDVREYDLTYLRDQVSVVLQNNQLFSGTIRENILWGNEYASMEEIEHVSKLSQAHDFIMSFPNGYDTMITRGGTNVSGGQKQRICIARALLKMPKIIILDDSTSAVDTKTESSIQKAFREELPETTKIIIAQRISSIKNADKIIVLDDGKIAAMGTSDELLKTCDIYKEIYESQQKGGEDE